MARLKGSKEGATVFSLHVASEKKLIKNPGRKIRIARINHMENSDTRFDSNLIRKSHPVMKKIWKQIFMILHLKREQTTKMKSTVEVG